MTKRYKITAVPTALPFGGTINQSTTKIRIVPPKEHEVGTAAIFDLFLRRRCPAHTFIEWGLKIGM